MKRVIAIATATVLALLVALTLNVAAQQPDTRDRTIMTFSSAVELPGMRLEPGTYVFRIADYGIAQRHPGADQDEKDIIGQWLFVPAERPEVTGDTVVTFRETQRRLDAGGAVLVLPGREDRQGVHLSEGSGAAYRAAHGRDRPD